MANITPRVLEEMMIYNNEITCVKETIGTLQNTELLVVSNIENGSNVQELSDPFIKLFNISAKKPYCDIEYVKQQKPCLNVHVGDFFGDLNVYDLDAFLQALVPNQTQLIETLVEQCNIHPQFTHLTQKLNLLLTECSRHCCQGRILAASKFGIDNSQDIRFSIAHPPFVYEIFRLLKLSDAKAVETYFHHLHNYLMKEIEVNSCLLCLTFDLYCKNDAQLKNFRLFFLEKDLTIPKDFSVDALYEYQIDSNQVEQYFIFEDVLNRIKILGLEDESGRKMYVLRFEDTKKNEVKLFF